MRARGARTTVAAAQTAAIPDTGSAGPPCGALAIDFAPRTPTRGRPTGRQLEAGMLPRRRGAIGAAIRQIFPATVGLSRFPQRDFSASGCSDVQSIGIAAQN